MTQRWIPAGAKGGKGGKGGGGGGGGGSEAPDTLRSIQYAKVLDLLGEGTIMGLANGLQSIFLDSVKLQNPDGSLNFASVGVAWTTGTPNQDPMPGQSDVEGEIAVGVQIKTTTPATRTITNPDVDRIRLTMAVPSLQAVDKKSGNINGTSVTFAIYQQSNGGGFQLVRNYTITGKTTGRYQRAITFALTGVPPWDIRIVRITADSTSQYLANDLYWDTYGEIIDAKLRYRNSAVVGIAIDAAQFSSIPQRTYDVLGMVIQVPVNYDPVARTYAGVWNGTFKSAYSNNPAWIFYDLVTNTRYGIGTFITAGQVDKFALYGIGQWCDEPVPDGRGGSEPRWTCNAVISDRQEAFDLLQSLGSVFRGAHFWTGGQLVTIADRPVDPVGAYTNANVIDGVFTYSGSDMRARHTQAAVTWNDPANLGQPRIALIDDPDGLSRYGLNRLDLIGIGCTSEGQAIRIGKWALYSELNEVETIKFSVGLDGAWCRPGDIIQIADVLIAGARRGGRLAAGSTGSTLNLDGPVTFTSPGQTSITVVRQDGTVQTVSVSISALNVPLTTINVSPAVSPAPLVDSVYVISSGDIQTQLFRVVAVEQGDDNITFSITALVHNPSKWAYVERNIALSDRDITNLGLPAVTALTAVEHLVPLSSISIGVVVNLTWASKAPMFEVRYRKRDGNWTTVTSRTLTVDLPVETGLYDFTVTPLNSAGIRGTSATIAYSVIGLAGLPSDVTNFRTQKVGDVAMLSWAPVPDLDVIIGGSLEIRYSPRTAGVDWNTSNTILRQVPGAATTAELPYRNGTYLIKARDSSGFYSKNAAIIITTSDDTQHLNFLTLCDSPLWPGVKQGTAVQNPQQWLVLNATGGLVDDMSDQVDTWSEVDSLPVGSGGGGEGEGLYFFSSTIDMGGVFPTRLTDSLLAFPYVSSSVFVDERAGTTNDWADWDAPDEGASGMAVMEVSQTNDDPALPTAVWSAYQGMQASTYTGRGFRFRLRLEAPENENIAVEEACITADISAKQDSGNDIVWVPNSMDILFTTKFFQPPAIAISIQNATVGDTWKLTNKTKTGFTIQLLTSAGAVITGARTFDWQSQGYGHLLGILGISGMLSAIYSISGIQSWQGFSMLSWMVT